ncbi:MAG: hypothetical protein H6Q21_2379 [Bacteroidetes bacterium]|nr:hypothetical protein [Bacteroidota bacterium]
MKRNLFNAILIIFPVVFFLICDFVLGIITIPKYHNQFRTKHFYYHHGLMPNKASVATWNDHLYPVYTNSLGFRDSRRKRIDRIPDHRRILFLGDSHTEGVGVIYPRTFTGLLQSFYDSLHVEILNGSAVSYSPKIYYLKSRWIIEKMGLRTDELVVCLDLSDLQNELVYEDYNPSDPGLMTRLLYACAGFLRNHSFAFHQIRQMTIRKETKRFLERAKIFDSYRGKNAPGADALEMYAGFFTGFRDDVLLSDPKFHGVGEWMYDTVYKVLAQKGISLGMENMEKLSALCRDNNIALTLSVHPWLEQIQRKDTSDWYVETWRAFAGKNKLGFINLYPAFINPSASSIYGQDPFLPSDNHWSEYGHRIVANEFIRNFQNKLRNQESEIMLTGP